MLTKREGRHGGAVVKVLLIVVILALGGAAGGYFILTERSTGRKEKAAEVESVAVKRVSPDTYPALFDARGTVEASRAVKLQPRVSGEITAVSRNFIPGGQFEKGDTMLVIDRQDYQLNVNRKENELKKARARLKMERGEQEVAREELGLSGQKLSGLQQELALRQPQLSQAEAEVETARLALQQAHLDLERATVRAPFDAHILERQVERGANVSPGQVLAHLAGTGEYWVEVTVPVARLRWLNFPDSAGDTGSEVKIYSAGSDNRELLRTGYIKELIGQVERETRQARLLVAVEDPLGLESSGRDKLLLGNFVELEFLGENIPGVVRLDRELLRRNNRVWVLDESGRLDKRKVEIVFGTQEDVFVKSGLADGDRLINSELSRPVDGTRLKVHSETADE
ncbi:MAG: efflux RND transporter periplasmic adaptor subunit [bacterium]